MRLIDADKLIEDYKEELKKVDFENLSDNDKLIIMTSAKALIDFTKRQPIVENIYNQALDDFIKKAEEELCNIYKSNWNDFDIGMKLGYQYSIKIAEELKK